jgi:hypothetical protein
MSDDELSQPQPKIILDDFNDSLYASKSTLAADFGNAGAWKRCLKKIEYIDPRGYINIGKFSF